MPNKNKKNASVSRKTIAIGAVLVLIFVGLLVALLPASGQESDVVLSVDIYQQYVDEGGSATYTVYLNNTGAEEHTVNLTVENPNEADWDAYLSEYNITIGPGEIASVFLTVVAVNAEQGDSVIITVHGTDEYNFSTNSVSTNTIVRLYGVDLSSPDPDKSVDPGDSVEYEIVVENTGINDLPDTIELSSSTPPPGWNTYFSEDSVELLPGEFATVYFTVEVPLGELAGDYNITVTGTSVGDPTKSDSIVTTTTVNAVYNFTMSVYPESAWVIIGESVEYILNITNYGNVEDTIDFTHDAPYGWSVVFEEDPLIIGPGETEENSVWITPNASVPAGEVAIINITGTSEDGIESHTVTTTTTAYELYYEGDIDDNVADGNEYIFWNGTNYVYYDENYFGIVLWTDTAQDDYDGEGTDETYIDTDGDGEFDTIYDPNGYVTPPPDPTPTPTPDPYIYGIVVDLYCGNNTQYIYAGESATYTIIVTNTWNVSTVETPDIDLEYDIPEGWSVNISFIGLRPLAPGENFTVIVEVISPIDALADEIVSVEVIGTSEVDPTKFDNVTTITGVLLTPGVEVIAPLGESAEPTQSIVYDFIIYNTGNGDETFNISAYSEHGWITDISHDSIFIPYNEWRTVQVTITIPQFVPEDTTDILTLNATSQTVPSVSDENSTVTTVLPSNGVELYAPVTEKDIEPGSYVLYEFYVYNPGNINATVELTAEIDEASELAGWTATLDQYSAIVGPGESVPVILNVTAPPDAPVGWTAITTVNATVLDPQGIVWPKEDFLEFITTAIQIYGVDLEPEYQQGDTDVGVPIVYTITVTNTGNGLDTILLSNSTPPLGWTAVLSTDSVDLDIGESQNITLTVTPPLDAPAGFTATIYVTGTSSGNPSKFDTVTTETSVNQFAGVNVSTVPPVDKTGVPNEVITHEFNVTNTGNGVDYYYLDAVSSQGWDVNIVGGDYIGLDSGETVTVAVEVTIPQYTPAGTVDTLNFTATSEFDYAVSDYDYATITVAEQSAVDIYFDFDPEINEQTKLTYPGDSVIFNITVENLGNLNDTFNLTLDTSALPSDWNAVFENGLSYILVYVLIGGTENVTLNVTTSPDAFAYEEYDVIITANSTTDPTASDSIIATTMVTEYYGIDVYIPPPNYMDGDPGELINITFYLKNLGNYHDTVDLGYVGVPAGWFASFSENPVNLTPKENKTLYFLVTIGDDAYAYTVAHIEVWGFSYAGDEQWDVGDPTDFDTIDIEVNRIFGIDVSGPDYFEIFPGETRDYTITVINTGNYIDVFTLVSDITVEYWSVTLSDYALTLDMSQSQDVTVTVTCPANQSSNEYVEITIIGFGYWDYMGTEDYSQPFIPYDDHITTVFVLPNVDLTVTALTYYPALPYENDIVTINVTIYNYGPDNITESFWVRVNIDGTYLDEFYVGGLNADTYMSFQSTWTAVSGEYVISAIVDYYDDVQEADETNNILTKPITVLSLVEVTFTFHTYAFPEQTYDPPYPLSYGWNFISMPLINDSMWASDLAEIIGDSCLFIAMLDENGEYITYIASVGSVDFQILPDVGYFVYVNQPGVTFTVSGYAPGTSGLPIDDGLVNLTADGWNHVGWTSLNASLHASDIVDLLLEQNVTTVTVGMRDLQGRYIFYNSEFGGVDFPIYPGYGYFIQIDNDAVLYYPE